MEIDYKELLIKYVNHITKYEGRNYLSEGYVDGSTDITEKEAEEIQKLLE